MSDVALVIGVSGVIAIGLIVVLGILTIIGLKVLKGGKHRGPLSEADEARMIQDIYHGLARMEQRVETLETLLLDQQKKGVTQ